MQRLRTILSMIKIEHSVFALPFAFMGAFLAARTVNPQALGPAVWPMVWIIVAMVTARSAAMTMNRIADREIDARNPRTCKRALPAGKISVRFAWQFLIVNIAIFFVACAMLNRLCLLLSPAAVAIMLGYSYTKRFTPLCHLWLGGSIGVAPTAAWIGVTGEWSWAPVILTGVVATWVAGFDIIYACQDVEHDRSEPNVRSLPKSIGVGPALVVSALLHAATVALLLAVPYVWPMNGWYYGAVAVVALLLVLEHTLVRPSDLTRAGQAFWVLNGWVGFIILGGILASL